MARQVGHKPESYYTKQVIKDGGVWDEEEFGKEYLYLSKRVNRALAILERKYPRAETLTEQERMPSLSSLYKNGQLDWTEASNIVSQSYRFLKSDISTIKGFEKQLSRAIRSFNYRLREIDPKTGKEVVHRVFNKSNVWDLFDFLKDYRQKYKEQKIPASDQVIDAYYSAVQNNISKENLLNNIESYKEQVNRYGEIRAMLEDDTSSDVYSSLREKNK